MEDQQPYLTPFATLQVFKKRDKPSRLQFNRPTVIRVTQNLLTCADSVPVYRTPYKNTRSTQGYGGYLGYEHQPFVPANNQDKCHSVNEGLGRMNPQPVLSFRLHFSDKGGKNRGSNQDILSPERTIFKLTFADKKDNNRSLSLNQQQDRRSQKTTVIMKKLSFKQQRVPALKDWTQTRHLTDNRDDHSIVTPQAPDTPKIKVKTTSPKLADFAKGKALGKGYFGQVFLVRHIQLGFVCAMKVVSRELIRKQRTEGQILREIKISLFVDHPNIVQMYGFFVDQSNIYILQQLMTDDQVFKILKKTRTFTERQTAYIIGQMLSALDYLHSNSITHRDIKSQNILMEKGVAKLCDFGWAVHDPEDFRTSNIGTLLYLSPENIKGEGYDKRNDIWAMGILTYQMLIGNVPFTIWGDDQKHKILSDQVRFPGYIQISDTAKDFILKMLEKDPDNRSSVMELQTHPFLFQSGVMEFISLS